ncbi:hypothetical protein WJX72_003222 [[Myrmecia] bisecta]|uniref:Cytoplasmic dynein 2 light intermediate chain 1 n=1 Tax=[Myrmecia] bisecta TaxID=41462 RepID=A0AAW1P6V0_9CHLO
MAGTHGAGTQSTSGPAIYTPNTLWAQLIEQNRAEARKPEGRADSYLYFVGSRFSGKSTLLTRFLRPEQADVPKPTEGLDYTYIRKPSSGGASDRKDLTHVWELSGGPELACQVIQGDNIFLGQKQVTSAVVVIVVDLSKPSEALDSLLFWLARIKATLQATYGVLERKGSKLPEQLRGRAKRYFGSSHEDNDTINHTGISIIVAATKHDTFRNEDAEVRKIMARTLRYVAHMHGASLVYLGGLGKAGAGAGTDTNAKDTAADRALLANFRAMLTHLAFVGLDKRMNLRLEAQTDHLQPLMVPMSADRLKDIGRPRGAGADASPEAALEEWRAVFATIFPPKPAEEKRKFDIGQPQFAEPDVDAVSVQKDAELAAYLQQKAAHQEELAAAKEAKRKALVARQQARQRSNRQLNVQPT